jgi:hypothetical protein
MGHARVCSTSPLLSHKLPAGPIRVRLTRSDPSLPCIRADPSLCQIRVRSVRPDKSEQILIVPALAISVPRSLILSHWGLRSPTPLPQGVLEATEPLLGAGGVQVADAVGAPAPAVPQGTRRVAAVRHGFESLDSCGRPRVVHDRASEHAAPRAWPAQAPGSFATIGVSGEARVHSEFSGEICPKPDGTWN